MSPVEPPRIPVRVLEWTLGSARNEPIVGDLAEEWSTRRARNRWRADAWIWLQAMALVPRFLWCGRQAHRGSGERKGAGMFDKLWTDVRYAARTLAKAPFFTAVAVATLALGIGANTAIFSVVNAVLIRPLPLADSERLVRVRAQNAQGRPVAFSYPTFRDLQGAKSLETVATFVPQSVNLTGLQEPTRVRGGFVTDEFFSLLRLTPAMGRAFVPGRDDVEGAAPTCILQHETWQGLLGGDPAVLGRTLVLNNQPFTVVGVLPAGFRFPFDEIEVWLPFHTWPPYRSVMAQAGPDNRNAPLVAPIARLRPDVTLGQASAEVRALLGGLSTQHPEAVERSGFVQPLQDSVVGDAHLPLVVLLAAVALVLLIACANVANLMLARAASRQREMATRVALGAARGRLVRQLLTETGILWAAGCALGLLAGYWGRTALVAASPVGLPGGLVARLDATVFGYTLALTASTAILFGLVPALRFSRPDLAQALKQGGRSDAGAVRAWLRGALVVSQVALALILLVGAGLLLRSLGALTRVDPGFAAQGLLTMEYRLPANKYPQGPQQYQFHREVVERVRALPGVRSATVIRALPFSGNGSTLGYDLPEAPAPGDNLPRARFNVADPYTFETMGIPLLRGRTFDERDRADAPLVVVVSKRLSDLHWPGQDPLGRKVRIAMPPAPVVAEVIGVVGDIKHSGLDETELPFVYAAQAQQPYIFNTLVARTEGDPLAMAATVRGALWSVDRDQPVWKIRTQESLVEGSTGFASLVARLIGLYSALALLLAAVGIYGLMAYMVAQRTREVGLRMALGAQGRDVLGLMLRDGMKLTALGVLLGLAGALGLARLIRGMLFGTSPADPLTFGGVAALLLLVALAASFLPARRATRVDPLVALHHE